MPDANGFANRTGVHAAAPSSPPGSSVVSLSASPVSSVVASDPPMISVARVLATCRSASRSVCTYCFMVKATSAWPMRWLSAFQSIFAARPAVAHVVQVDLRQPGRRSQSLESPRDGVRVGRRAVLPAEQDPVALVVRAEFLPPLVQHLDVDLECSEGERVEHENVLCVLGLAIRLDNPAIYDDPCDLDGECSGAQVEKVTASACQFAAPHAEVASSSHSAKKRSDRARCRWLSLAYPRCLPVPRGYGSRVVDI